MASQLLLLSTSTVHGSGYLDYCADQVAEFLGSVRQVLFIPYARPSGISHADYTRRAQERFAAMGLELTGIEAAADARAAVRQADALFVGGGNTFLLLRELYATGLPELIRQRVMAGMFYMGASAGSNVAGLTIGTTNDMPVVFPPSLDALGLVPFNINPHYIDPDPKTTHRGETRDTRINEFHVFNEQPVVALREGAWLRVGDGSVRLEGSGGARLFRPGVDSVELAPGASLNPLVGTGQ
jgi:dipeptidase E